MKGSIEALRETQEAAVKEMEAVHKQKEHIFSIRFLF